MLDGLVAGDGATESVALQGVFLGHFQRGVRAAHLFPGEQHGCPVEQPLGRRPAFAVGAERFRRIGGEGDPGVGAGGVEGADRFPIDPVELGEMETGAVAGIGSCDHHGEVGDIAVRDGNLDPVECAG